MMDTDQIPMLQVASDVIHTWQSQAKTADITVKSVTVTMPDESEAIFTWNGEEFLVRLS